MQKKAEEGIQNNTEWVEKRRKNRTCPLLCVGSKVSNGCNTGPSYPPTLLNAQNSIDFVTPLNTLGILSASNALKVELGGKYTGWSKMIKLSIGRMIIWILYGVFNFGLPCIVGLFLRFAIIRGAYFYITGYSDRIVLYRS